MSKIAPMQAQALGRKPASPKKPVADPAAEKSAMATTEIAAKPEEKTAKANADKVSTDKKNSKKEDKKTKSDKVKMERDSFTMPKEEYAQIISLKTRLIALGQPAKKSELLRAGIKLLAIMSDDTLKATLGEIPVIKTGRPNKKA